MQKRLLIAGGTGLIGSAISELAKKGGWEVFLLSRSNRDGHIQWDPKNLQISLKETMAFDAIINLAGASIAGERWTAKRKKLILDSRLKSCATLERYLASGQLKTEVYIGASAIGIYGNHEEEMIDENTDINQSGDWLAETAKAWEEGHHRIKNLGIKTIIIRIGLVLSRQGGAMKEIIQTAPFGFLGYFGDGQQKWSWIHIDDVVGIFLFALDNEFVNGPVNATAPNPLRMKDFASTLGKVMKRPSFFTAPGIALKILFGEGAEFILNGSSVIPQKIVKSGYKFKFENAENALKDLLK